MKAKPFLLSCGLLLLGGLVNVKGQSWSSNYQSYSQKDVNKGGAGSGSVDVNTFVDPVKNSVDGASAPVASSQNLSPLAESHRASYYPYPAYEVAASNAIPQYGHGYYYRPSTDNRQGLFGGTGDDDGGDGGGGDGGGAGASGLAGLAGALGLLGLKGVKGMLALTPLALSLPFLPILLPIIALPILLPLLALLLFIPIPIVVTPGRSLSSGNFAGGLAEFSERAWRMGKLLPEMTADVVQSEGCVERISCEVARISRNLQVEGWMDKLTSSLPKENKYTKRILGGIYPEKKDANATGRKISGDCSVFTCNAKSVLAKHMTKI